jgi:hypothetical protein
LILLPLIILLASVHVWLNRRAEAESLAYEAARIAAISIDRESAEAAIDELERHHETRLDTPAEPCPEDGGCVRLLVSGEFERAGEVRSEVSVLMPGLVIPFVGAVGGTWWTTGHSEAIDPYRALP